MDTLLSDMRFGVRGLVTNPGFTAVVAITLALGIGASSVIFSFVNVLALQPLPIKDEERVGFIEGLDPQGVDERART